MRSPATYLCGFCAIRLLVPRFGVMDVITAEGDRATMTIFAISNDNYISVLDAIEDAQSNPESPHFSSLKQLGSWPQNGPRRACSKSGIICPAPRR